MRIHNTAVNVRAGFSDLIKTFRCATKKIYSILSGLEIVIPVYQNEKFDSGPNKMSADLSKLLFREKKNL